MAEAGDPVRRFTRKGLDDVFVLECGKLGVASTPAYQHDDIAACLIYRPCYGGRIRHGGRQGFHVDVFQIKLVPEVGEDVGGMGLGMDHGDGGHPVREGYPFKAKFLEVADRPFNILRGLLAASSPGSLNDRGRMDMEFEEDDGFLQIHHRGAEDINAIPRPYAPALNGLKRQIHTDAFSLVGEFNAVMDTIPECPFGSPVPDDPLRPEDAAGAVYGVFEGSPRHILENGTQAGNGQRRHRGHWHIGFSERRCEMFSMVSRSSQPARGKRHPRRNMAYGHGTRHKGRA